MNYQERKHWMIPNPSGKNWPSIYFQKMNHLVNNSKKIQSQLTLCLSLAILSSDRHHPYTQTIDFLLSKQISLQFKGIMVSSGIVWAGTNGSCDKITFMNYMDTFHLHQLFLHHFHHCNDKTNSG